MIRTRFSTKADGDLRCVGTSGRDAAALGRRREAIDPGSWTWLRQVHGATVVVVTEPGGHAGAEADAAVTTAPGAALAVHTADCVPVLLADGDRGVIGAAHVGWRGLVAGVVERTVDAMDQLGARRPSAVIGPHIRGRCYEFGEVDIERVAERYGPSVRTTTMAGTRGLDLAAAIRVALADRAIEVTDAGGCTACEPDRFFSHRARQEDGRHASVISLIDEERR